MSEKKFFELQQQVRRDNEDHQDFLRDLNNWEKDIKKKDDELRHKQAPSDKRILPPVRNRENQLHQKKTRKKSKPKEVEKPPSEEASANGKPEEKKKKIRVYDYRSWDKFDVDKACAEIDGDEADQESSDTTDYETDSDAEREMEEKGGKYKKL